MCDDDVVMVMVMMTMVVIVMMTMVVMVTTMCAGGNGGNGGVGDDGDNGNGGGTMKRSSPSEFPELGRNQRRLQNGCFAEQKFTTANRK
jgi:hypothetical protein